MPAVTRSRPPGGLIGRGVETSAVDDLLEHLRERSATLVIRGEAGIGKSALLEHARERASSIGARTLDAVGVESEAQLAFASLHQLLRPLGKRIQRLPGPQREALDAAFGIADDLEPDRFRVAVAAFQLVCDAADSSPVILIVDDAHWIDRSSLDVLTFIARRLDSEPVAILASVREGFATALDEARLPVLPLDRLQDAAAGELLDENAPDLAPALRTRVLQEAAGNPLGLVELAVAASSAREPRERLSEAPLTLSARLERTFAARLDELPEATRLALLASALDDRASLEEVLEAATKLHQGPPVTLSDLDSAVAARLVEIGERSLSFRHPLMRSAVEQTASAADLHAMHAAWAEVIADDERRLWHRAASTVGCDEDVAAALDEYAHSARRRGAIMAAAGALERAATLTEDPQRKGERLVRAAELAYELGSEDIVRGLLAQAESLMLGTLEATRAAWLGLMVGGGVWYEAGATKTFVRIAERMLDGGDSDMALRSLVPIALRCWWTRPRAETRQYLVDAARRVARTREDPRLLAVVGLAHPEAHGAAVLRRVERARPHELSDPLASMHVGLAAGAAGDWGSARPFLALAVERMREQGRLGVLTQALLHYTFATVNTGEWRASAAAAAEAERLARDTRQPQFGLSAALAGALVTAMRGTDTDLEALLARPERTLLEMKAGSMLAPAHLARGAAALGEGRHEDAFEHLWPIFDPADPAFHLFIRWWAILDLVEAGSRGGHRQEVAQIVAALEPIAQRGQAPILLAGLACARPLLGEDGDSDVLFEDALAHDLTNYPFLRARTLLSYGGRLRRRRRVAESRRPLRNARELFDGLGAARWSERARQELRATGETIARLTPDTRDRLTAQELQIAELAATGLSNREIGERLFLSHRTIGSHLYHIFPKLEITARAQLRAALEPRAEDR